MAVNRVPGVLESEFSYEEGSGAVTYDPEATDPETFLSELAGKTGFRGRVVETRAMPDPTGVSGDGADAHEVTDHEPMEPDNR